MKTSFGYALILLLVLVSGRSVFGQQEPVKVFIFAGQSNMVGSDSRVADIDRFPPFAGLEQTQPEVLFSYCIGRENKTRSDGWVKLQPVNSIVGPELSFAREITVRDEGPVAIIKVAAGGTHLGGDWNPDVPSGFEMYPLALELVRTSLRQLDEQGVAWQLAGFMWHQGENDMFEQSYMENYGTNLANFIASWRRDLNQPDLPFFVGELCTKTIWGMDLRPRMYAISKGQKTVAAADPLVTYVPTSHIGVEIGSGVGLHYHYGTLGQLEHGVNYAHAWLRSRGKLPEDRQVVDPWPFEDGSTVRLFVLAGHRNMEGERAFVQDLQSRNGNQGLLEANGNVVYQYSIGGGYRESLAWEPMRPAGYYDTFGPELSFAATLQANSVANVAIAKFTHSGSQVLDWTPQGSEAKSRNLYPAFIEFVERCQKDLEKRGHQVQLEGVFYHVGENDMSFAPHRERYAERLKQLVTQSRQDLDQPALPWFVSQQRPTDHERVNQIDVVSNIEQAFADDSRFIHLKTFDLPGREQQLVISTDGIVKLGQILAEAWLAR